MTAMTVRRCRVKLRGKERLGGGDVGTEIRTRESAQLVETEQKTGTRQKLVRSNSRRLEVNEAF